MTASEDQLLNILSHRGPDSHGSFTEKNTTLLHTRLSIIDLSDRADMPLFDEEERYALISNQEIYNHEELRAELEELGHEFSTESDTEVIVHAYEEYGAAAVEKLRGMFASAILDRETGELFLARDRFGIKPLYYAYEKQDGRFAFSSERKVLRFLGFGRDDIAAVPPGHTLRVTDDGLTFQEYYPELDEETVHTDEQEVADTVRELVENAVEKRCMADVPVGTFLSGGLDSSIITAVAAEYIPDVQTFSVGLDDSTDLPFAKKVADAVGADHHVRTLNPAEAVEIFPAIIYHLEDPIPFVVRNAVATYFLAETASDHVKVALTGSGADELFGGYDIMVQDSQLQPGMVQETIFTGLPEKNLNRVDKLTMAHALEARTPFLDTDLVEYALQVDPALKVRNGTRKYVLRKAFEDLLPHDVVHRPKLAFQRGTGLRDLLKNAITLQDHESEYAFYQDLYDEMIAQLADGRDDAFNHVRDELVTAYNM